jgi:hypothetical protein
MLGRDGYGFYKKRVRTRYSELVFLHPVGFAVHVMHSGASGPWISMHYFSCSGGTVQKVHRDTLRRTCVFASDGICGSRNAFWCVRGMKCRRTIFHGRVGLIRIPQKARQDL